MAVYKRENSKFWQYEFECGGKRYRGSTKETTKARAEKFERRERLAIETGERSLSQKVFTWKQMLERYQPPASMLKVKRVVEADERIPGRTPHHLVWVKAHEMRDEMAAEGYSPCTINRRLAVIKRVLNLAHNEWGWLPTAEGKKIIKLSEKGTAREVFLELEELEGIASHMEPVTQAALWIAAFTGIRRSNVLGLRPEHWDPETKRLTLPGYMMKNGKPFSIPVPQAIWHLMNDLPLQTDDWGLRSDWEQAIEKAGWADSNNRFGMRLRWHDLRHTFASLLLGTGEVNMGTLRDIMGHSSLLVTNRYSHLDASTHTREMNSAFDKLGVNKPQLKLVK